MLNSEEKKTNHSIRSFAADCNYSHPLSHLYRLSIIINNPANRDNVYVKLCDYLDISSLCRMSCCNKEFNYISSSESIWKPLCLSKWPELKMATSLEDDPFPAYKSCFKRKASQESTSMQDLMKIFGRCDWYSCPNGHLYAIGECRMAVMMSRCPECGESIGGRYHRHLDTNHRIGAVNASYNPLRYNLNTEDKVQFGDVANVIHTTRQTAFSEDRYTGLGSITEDEIRVEDDKYNNNHYNSTICEQETVDFDALLGQFGHMKDAPEYLVCPLSLDVFVNPVVTPSGSIYERKFIVNWLTKHDTDPMDANIKLKVEELESEADIKRAARLWRESRNDSEGSNEMGSGLKWADKKDRYKEDMSEDEEWNLSDDDEEEGADVNMNDFKNGLTGMLASQRGGDDAI